MSTPLRLPDDWQQWLELNVGRGCAPADLLRDLTTKGGFAEPLAREVLRRILGRQAAGAPAAPTAPIVLPGLDQEPPRRRLHGRTVRVVAGMDSPQIAVLDGLVTAPECAALIAIGEQGAEPATVVDSASGALVTHRGRRSHFTHLGESRHPMVLALEQRLSMLVNWPVSHFETLQLIHYGPGDEYRPHHDWFDPLLPGSAASLARGGQRVGTFVVYLQAPISGGGTRFPAAGGLLVQPQPGRAVWFRNVHSDGVPDAATLHAGDPVIEGSKWIVTAWLRERAWRPSPPAPTSQTVTPSMP